MTVTRVPRRYPNARRLLPFVTATGCLAIVPGAASATAPSCPTHRVEETAITWGAPSADHPLATVSVTSGIQLAGLATDGERHPPTIRTRRDTAGRGHPVLCANGKVRARLPTVARGQTIQAASVNGTAIAWRQTTSRTRTTTVRAIVRNARLRDIRRATISTPNRLTAADDHRIVVTPTGTVAWALDARTGTSTATKVWVWPRAHRMPTALETNGIDDVLSLRVLDDQNVLTDSSRFALRYAPATPGRCPVLIDPAPASSLGGWNVRGVRGWSLGDDSESQGESWNIVCDPQTGRYVDIVGDEASATPGHDSGIRNTTHLVRSGEWLVSSQHGAGSIAGDRTLIANATTGRRYLATGRADGAGIDHSGEYDTTRPPSGATVGPGYLAFVATNINSSNRDQTLVLSDANGTRTIATGSDKEPLGALASNGTVLTWTAKTALHTAPITPAADTPYATLQPDEANGY